MRCAILTFLLAATLFGADEGIKIPPPKEVTADAVEQSVCFGFSLDYKIARFLRHSDVACVVQLSKGKNELSSATKEVKPGLGLMVGIYQKKDDGVNNVNHYFNYDLKVVRQIKGTLPPKSVLLTYEYCCMKLNLAPGRYIVFLKKFPNRNCSRIRSRYSRCTMGTMHGKASSQWMTSRTKPEEVNFGERTTELILAK